MALTNESSTQLAKQEASPPTMLDPRDLSGKLRIARFDFTQGAAAGDANSTARLIKLPAGKIRVFLALSRVANSAFGAARTLDLGWEAHTKNNGVAVAANEIGFDAAQDVSAAGAYAPTGTVGSDETIELDSDSGIVVVAKCEAATLPAAATLKGYIVYACE